MNPRLFSSALLAFACVVLGLVIWKNVNEAEAAAVAWTEIGSALTRLEAVQDSHERRRNSAEKAAAAQSAGTARDAPLPPAAASGSAPAPRPKSNSITDFIRDDPEGQVRFLAMQRARLDRRYGPLFRNLQMSREQAAAFQDNILRRDERQMDLRHVVDGVADAALQTKLEREITAHYEAAQRALLGEAGFAQLKEYERTSWIRGVVSSIAGVAAVEHVPFTPLQAEQLVQAIAETSASYSKGGFAATNEVDWARVEERARTILSPAQFEVFSTMDPGPSTPGILQSRMYALVERAVAEDRQQAKSPPAPPRG